MTTRRNSASVWYADLPHALMTSAMVIGLLTLLMLWLQPHEVRQLWSPKKERITLTHCEFSDDRQRTIAAYWREAAGAGPHQFGLAMIELGSAPETCRAAVIFSRERQLFARGSGDELLGIDLRGRLTRYDAETGAVHGDYEQLALDSIEGFQLSPEGQWLIAWNSEQLTLYDTAARRTRWQSRQTSFESAVFYGGDAIIAACKGEFSVLSRETGEKLRGLGQAAGPVRQLAVDGASERLTCLYFSGDLETRSTISGRRVWIQKRHGRERLPKKYQAGLFAPLLCYSQDRRFLATAAFETEWVLAIWCARTGERLQTLRGHDREINGGAFLTNDTLASWGSDGTLRLWSIRRGTSRVLRLDELLPS